MLGPIAGGVLVASVGGSYAFAFNALALAASAGLAWSVVGSFNEHTGEKLRGGLGAGFQFLWNDRVLRWITGAWVLILCGVGALLVSEFPLAELFHSGSLGYGLLISSWGAGTLIGSVFAARAVRRSTYWSLVVGTVGLSVMLGSVAIAPFLWIVCLTQLVGGSSTRSSTWPRRPCGSSARPTSCAAACSPPARRSWSSRCPSRSPSAAR